MTVYAPGSQILSADLNKWQTTLYGDHEDWIHVLPGMLNAPDPSLHWAVVGGPGLESRTAGGNVAAYVPMRRKVGERIKSITVYGRAGDAAGELLTCSLYTVATDGSQAAIGVTKQSGQANGNTSVGWTTADAGLSPDGLLIETGKFYGIEVVLPQTSSAAEVRVYGVLIGYDRPEPP